MKGTINISEFLRTGKFGLIQVDDSFEEVITQLGEPEGCMNVNKHLKGIHYGKYEFIFYDNRLLSIQNDHFNPEYPELMEFENGKIVVNPKFLRADRIKNLSEIKKELKSLGIEFSLIDHRKRKVLKTEGNVIIDFNNEKWSDQDNDWVKIENQEDFELIGIRFSPQNE